MKSLLVVLSIFVMFCAAPFAFSAQTQFTVKLVMDDSFYAEAIFSAELSSQPYTSPKLKVVEETKTFTLCSNGSITINAFGVEAGSRKADQPSNINFNLASCKPLGLDGQYFRYKERDYYNLNLRMPFVIEKDQKALVTVTLSANDSKVQYSCQVVQKQFPCTITLP